MGPEFNDNVKASLRHCKQCLDSYRFNGDMNAQNLYYAINKLLEAVDGLNSIMEIKEKAR